ncbi:hypothetical protein FRC06_008586 [Ceratobasidium sp. 370]|nr:hypothetical protein FRC06_008586 [Ceratobasidium sp. 370]
MTVQGPGTVRWMTPEAQRRHLKGLEPKHDPLSLRQDPATYGSARQYKRQGETAFRIEAYGEALDYYDQARKLFERVGDKIQTGSCLRDLGWTYMRLRNHESARVYFKDARELYCTVGDLKIEPEAIQDLAAAERLAGNFARAREYLTYTYDACMSAHLYLRVGWCLNGLGVLYVDEGNWEAAHECFDKSGEVAQQHGSQGLLGRNNEHRVKRGDVTISPRVHTEVSPEKKTRRVA